MVKNSHGKRMVREDLIKKIKELASKQLVVKAKVANVKEISSEVLNGLECGDIVLKKTGNQYHSYIVTYKEANQGICLTYIDASCVETQSYDFVDGAWVYNSEDKFEFTNYELPVATASRLGGVKVGDGLTITAAGILKTKNLMEDIVDEDGHNRFIEGNLTYTDTEDITTQYARWSLSGTHLMIVHALKINANTVVSAYNIFSTVTLPEWIFNKIFVIGGSLTTWITPKLADLINTSSGVITEIKILLNKSSNNTLQLYSVDSFTPTADSVVRLQFDLIIDNQ